MTLPAMVLDDLTWQDMVDAIRTRIAANSRGKWTMHGPQDTGVTLLELFAYLFEQRIYWLDQVHAPLARALLALLDDTPRVTQAARTVLAFPTPDPAVPTRIVAGALFSTTLGEQVLPLTTLESVDVLPVHDDDPDAPGSHPKLSLRVDGHDQTARLSTLGAVPLLPADGSAGRFEIVLWLDRTLDASERDGTCTLLLELAAPDACAPEWAPRSTDSHWFSRVPSSGYDTVDASAAISGSCGLEPAVIPPPTSEADPLLGEIAPEWAARELRVPAPATLALAYSTGPGAWKPLHPESWIDGTGGLRRSGVWRVRIPVDWAQSGADVDGLTPYALAVSCEEGTFASAPVLTRLVPNVAVARQVESVQLTSASLEPQLDAWLKLPGQQLALDRTRSEPIEDSVQLELREADGEWRRWRATDDFYRHGPGDRVFTVDRARKLLRFGNGLTGRIPVLAAPPGDRARVCYLAGGGSVGNLARQVWQSPGVALAPVNAVPAVGGAEAESFREADARVARDLQRTERAVTAPDYETLAKTTPGVAIARAHTAVGFHPDFPCQALGGVTTVFVVPEVPRGDGTGADLGVATPIVDPGALRTVAERLEARRLLSHEVYVRAARYRAVYVDVDLVGIVLDEASLTGAIRAHLARHLDALIGGEAGAGWEFGAPLRPTALLHQVQTVLGKGVAVARVGIALDAPDDFEDCADVSIGAHELVYLAGFDASYRRSSMTNGGLR